MKKLSFLFLLFQSILLSAQFEYDIRTYGEESGFYDTDEISDIHVDSEGYVWIVSFSGITRYDGHSFTKITTEHVAHGSFFRFSERKKKPSYIIDLFGGSYEIRNDSIHPRVENDLIISSSSTKAVPSLYIDEYDTIHYSFNEYGATYVKQVGSFIKKPLQNSKEHYYGIGAFKKQHDFQLFNFRDSVFKSTDVDIFFYLFDENYEVQEKIKIDRAQDEFRHIPLVDKRNNSSNYFLFSTGRGELIEVRNSKIISLEKFRNAVSIVIDDKQGTWISSHNDGVYFYKNYENNKKPDEHLFKGQNLIIFDQDRAGNIWLYSNEYGLASFNPKYQIKKRQKDEVIDAIGLNNSTLFYSSKKGKLISENLITGKIIEFDISELESNNNNVPSVFDIRSNDGELWISKRFGIYKRENGYWEGYRINDSINRPDIGDRYKLGETEFSESEIIGFKYKIYITLDYKRGSVFKYEFNDPINTCLKVKEQNWVGTQYGLFKSSSLDHKNPKIDTFFVGQEILDLAYFHNTFYVSVRNSGIFIINDNSVEEILYDNKHIKNSYFAKNDEGLWTFSEVGTFKLISLVSNSKEVFAYSPLDLRSIKEIEIDSQFLLLLNSKGIVKYKLEDIESDKLDSINFFIRDVQVNNKSILLDSTLNLKYNENFFEFYISSISLESEKISFRYNLNGLNPNWINTQERVIRFNSLSPGNYVFEIQSKLGEGFWSQSKKVKIIIAKPYWQEWWFILILIILFSCLILLAVRRQIAIGQKESQLLLQNLKAEQRALRAQIDPHYIFNIISSAQYFIIKKETEKANDFLNMFSKLLRGNLKQSGKNTISIKDEIDILTGYLNLEQFRLEHSFDFEIKVNDRVNQQEEQIPQFIIQPFVENAIQHGVKDLNWRGKILIDFNLELNYLIVTIQDNGLGIDATKELKKQFVNVKESFGIAIIQERIRLYNNEEGLEIIDLSTENKNGTKVIIKLKRKQNWS